LNTAVYVNLEPEVSNKEAIEAVRRTRHMTLPDDRGLVVGTMSQDILSPSGPQRRIRVLILVVYLSIVKYRVPIPPETIAPEI
jgi:hypothetical protein